jgi:pSer/pThr/pTyr-binding forkhead associated (FHA) protein
MANIYCPECGFQNPETANYCSKCGTALVREESGEATMALTPDQLDENGADVAAAGISGPALVVRSGGGRAGETFHLDREQTTIGRSPDCDIFLDDVTVSRKHAVVKQGPGRLTIEDLGSLNGTFLNRRRIESGDRDLADGDELQIGKYKLTFLQ